MPKPITCNHCPFYGTQECLRCGGFDDEENLLDD